MENGQQKEYKKKGLLPLEEIRFILLLMNKEAINCTKNLMDFISSSPSCYHVVDNAKRKLEENGFIELYENKPFNLERGKSYFVKRSSSSLIAFRIPKNPSFFHIVASHTDSPNFKLKWDSIVESSPLRLNVEGYGGLLIYSWLDRPLSVAGRVFLKNNGKVDERLVDLKDKLNVTIPSLAIHQNREANNGWKISIQKEMLPLFSDTEKDFLTYLCSLIGEEKDSIIDYDLFLYNLTSPSFSGANKEYFSAPKIDDLGCVFSSLEALCEEKSNDSISMICLFDNEETGSGTRDGALSDFLTSTLNRIAFSLNWNEEERYIALSSSFMLSADNGHAVHPAFPEKSDITNKPKMNGGVLLKYAASQKYTTNGETGAFTKALLEDNNIPYQVFHNNSDLPSGSTLGNLSTQKVSIKTSDVGVAELAMHSSYETAGSFDTLSLKNLFKAFFRF